MKILKLQIILLLLSSSIFGWGKTGHRVVGEVAETFLTKNAKLQIKKILGHHDLAYVSNWADDIKSDPNWKHAWDWHFCTVPNGETYEHGKYQGEAIEKVNDFISTLKNKKTPLEEKQVALKFLVHLVGDLHQPLHVGRKNDKGGNDIKVKWFWEETNLHSIWDSKLIDHQQLSYTEYTNFLLLNMDYSNIREWQGDTLMTYIYESQQYRDQCYDFTEDNLKWEYFYKNRSLLDLRLVQAGARLSGTLNRIFK